jgi:hypothetical protein
MGADQPALSAANMTDSGNRRMKPENFFSLPLSPTGCAGSRSSPSHQRAERLQRLPACAPGPASHPRTTARPTRPSSWPVLPPHTESCNWPMLLSAAARTGPTGLPAFIGEFIYLLDGDGYADAGRDF